MSPHETYSMPPRQGGGRFCILTIALMVALGIFWLRAARMPRNMPAPVSVEIPPPPGAMDMSEVALADVYPSEKSALAAIAHQAAKVIGPLDVQMPLSVWVEPSADASPVMESLSKNLPGAYLRMTQDKPANVFFSIITQSDDSASPSRQGEIRATLRGDHTRYLATRFIDRPWAADPGQYVNDHPDSTWIIGRSGKPALSESEARHSAEQDAARSILPLVEQQRPVETIAVHEVGSLHRPVAVSTLVEDIRRQLPVKDRFVQKFDRGFGTVWTEAILVDVSPGWLRSINHRQLAQVVQQERKVKSTAASAMIVLLTIVIAYFFLNAVTKSYFTTRLRTVAIVLALGVVIVAMGIISHP